MNRYQAKYSVTRMCCHLIIERNRYNTVITTSYVRWVLMKVESRNQSSLRTEAVLELAS